MRLVRRRPLPRLSVELSEDLSEIVVTQPPDYVPPRWWEFLRRFDERVFVRVEIARWRDISPGATVRYVEP